MNQDFAWDQRTPIGALANFTQGVAVFDEGLRCRAFNHALALLSGGPAVSHFGKTLSEICGCEDSSVEGALMHVACTGEALRSVPVVARPSARSGSKNWVVDLFPIRDAQWQFNLVGVVVSDTTAASRLQGLSFEALVPLVPDLACSDGVRGPSLRLLSARYRETLRRTVNLLNRSMAIRRQTCEMQIGLRLARFANAMGVQRQRQQQQRQQQQRRRVLNSRCFSSENWDLAPRKNRAATVPEASLEAPSPREAQVLRLVAEGKSNKEIGAMLRLSTRTVETYRARLMSKLKVHSSAELVRYAVRNEIVDG